MSDNDHPEYSVDKRYILETLKKHDQRITRQEERWNLVNTQLAEMRQSLLTIVERTKGTPTLIKDIGIAFFSAITTVIAALGAAFITGILGKL